MVHFLQQDEMDNSQLRSTADLEALDLQAEKPLHQIRKAGLMVVLGFQGTVNGVEEEALQMFQSRS
jgi:hypothetical protein